MVRIPRHRDRPFRFIVTDFQQPLCPYGLSLLIHGLVVLTLRRKAGFVVEEQVQGLI